MSNTIQVDKSANQLWKESNTRLPFSVWIEREKDKGMYIPNKFVQDSIANAKIQLGIEKDPNEVEALVDDNKWLGLSKGALIFSLVIITSAIAYKFYIHQKK